MMDGIKFNLIWLILLDEHMAPIMWRHCECKFMQIAEFDEYIFQIDYTQRTSYHQNLNYFYRSKSTSKQCKRKKSTYIAAYYLILITSHHIISYHTAIFYNNLYVFFVFICFLNLNSVFIL